MRKKKQSLRERILVSKQTVLRTHSSGDLTNIDRLSVYKQWDEEAMSRALNPVAERYSYGYDIFVDKDYVKWLRVCSTLRPYLMILVMMYHHQMITPLVLIAIQQ